MCGACTCLAVALTFVHGLRGRNGHRLLGVHLPGAPHLRQWMRATAYLGHHKGLSGAVGESAVGIEFVRGAKVHGHDVPLACPPIHFVSVRGGVRGMEARWRTVMVVALMMVHHGRLV